MARDDNRHRIRPIGSSDGTIGRWFAKIRRHSPICHRRPQRNVAQGVPNVLLKRSAADADRNALKRTKVTGEIGTDAATESLGIGSEDEMDWPKAPFKQFHHACLVIGEFERTQPTIIHRNQNRANGRVNRVKNENSSIHILTPPRVGWYNAVSDARERAKGARAGNRR